MKALVCVFVAAMLCGCGVEVATTAATGAAIKKQELEAGKQVKEMADKKIDAAKAAMQQREAQQESAGK